jgi:DNA-binding Lrp family transcriptional regulator
MKPDELLIQDNRKKGWFWSYNYILDRTDLDIYAKMIYMVLARHADGHNTKATVSYKELSSGAGCSVRKAKEAVLTLEEKGLIRKQANISAAGDHDANTYIFRAESRKRGNWFWSENALVDREDLGLYEKMVYLVLVRRADGRNTRSCVSYSQVAITLGCSRRQVIKVISSLIEKGLLSEPQPGPKGTNIYYINNVSCSDCEAAVEKSGEPCAPPQWQDFGKEKSGEPGAPPQNYLVNDMHQGSAPGSLEVVNEVHHGSASGSPIQERSINDQEHQQDGEAFNLLMNYGISQNVARRLSAGADLEKVKKAIEITERERMSGNIKKSCQGYLVSLLESGVLDTAITGRAAKVYVDNVPADQASVQESKRHLDFIRSKIGG